MIESVALWLIGKGVPDRLAKPVMIFGAALIALALLALAIRIHDRHVISTNDAQVAAKAEKANRRADAKAADQRVADERQRAAEAQNLSTILNMGGPDATRDPASVRDAQRAFYRCLRQQREAREAGRPSASCGP